MQRGIYALAAITAVMMLIPAYAFGASGTITTLSSGSINISCVLSPSAPTSVGACVEDSFPYMAIGVLLSFMVISLTYMLGKVINYRRLTNWYQGELWETIKTLILVGIIISSLVIMGAIGTALAGNVPASPTTSSGLSGALTSNLASFYLTAHNVYLSQQLGYDYNSFAALQGYDFGIEALKSISLSTWFPIPIITPWGVIGAVQSGSEEKIFVNRFISTDSKGLSIVADAGSVLVLPMLLFYQTQYDLFYYIVGVGLGVLIPIGIVLRAIPLLRNLGGTFVGIGIGAAIIYPALLVGFNMPISNYIFPIYSANTQPGAPNCPFSSGLVCQIWSGISGTLNNPYFAFNPISAPLGASVDLANGIFRIPQYIIQLEFGTTGITSQTTYLMDSGFLLGFINPLYSGSIIPTLNFIVDNTIMNLVQFLLVALDLLIGLILTKNITSLMGGSLRLGVGRIKLI